jgi:hypothetical protein
MSATDIRAFDTLWRQGVLSFHHGIAVPRAMKRDFFTDWGIAIL